MIMNLKWSGKMFILLQLKNRQDRSFSPFKKTDARITFYYQFWLCEQHDSIFDIVLKIQGFPSSVTPDYIPFQIWDLLQVCYHLLLYFTFQIGSFLKLNKTVHDFILYRAFQHMCEQCSPPRWFINYTAMHVNLLYCYPLLIWVFAFYFRLF